ncbi:MAG: SWIM zinc finger family protein, partial [Lachnospiraceae bacterium]|nr:SWIM zinc finger family protein [Lachnospiraceae bacterium]
MSDWKSMFREIDDDYLIGVSNKGIVKRAYKDMETTTCKIEEEVLKKTLSTDEEIAINVGEETVHIKVPLGESTCSCPSRSICRHIILGILVVKEAVSQETAAQASASQEIVSQESASQASVSQETVSREKVLQETDAHESDSKDTAKQIDNKFAEENDKKTALENKV